MKNVDCEDESQCIDVERSTYEHGGEPWKDEGVLQILYHDKGLSQTEIAEQFDIRQQTISYWMDKLDIEARLPMHERERKGIYRNERPDFRVQYSIDNFGGDGDDKIVTFYENNLVGLETAPLDLVAHDDTDVDHKINSPLHINIPENLRTMPSKAHRSQHDRDVIPHEIFLEDIGEPVDMEDSDVQTIYLSQAAIETIPTCD